MTEGFCTWCGELATSSKFMTSCYSTGLVKKSLGDLSDVGTPGPIPNPVVKDVSADGTWRATSRESRSLPKGLFYLKHRAVFSSAHESCIISFADSVRIINCPITIEECETFFLIVDHFVVSFLNYPLLRPSLHVGRFFFGTFHAERR